MGSTLQQAVQAEDIYGIKALLEDGSVKINGRDEKGWMALHYAVALNNKEICELLFERKANPNGACYDGQLNAYEIASDNKNEELLKYLKSKGCQKNLNRNLKEKPASTPSATVDTRQDKEDEPLKFVKVKKI